jgi:hypothetical protein
MTPSSPTWHRDVATGAEDHPDVRPDLYGIELLRRASTAAKTSAAANHPSVDLLQKRAAFMVARSINHSRSPVVYSPRFSTRFRGAEPMRYRLVGMFVLLCVATASAQSVSTAQINGRCAMKSGPALPGATITSRKTDTGLDARRSRTEAGLTSCRTFPIRSVSLRGGTAGFRKFVQTGIVLQVNANPTLNVTLQLGQSRRRLRCKGPRRWSRRAIPASAR